jgi:hypothetical protein
MSRTQKPRECVQCTIDIWWDGTKWKDELGSNKCDGYAKGHKPDNKLRKEQIAMLNKKPV